VPSLASDIPPPFDPFETSIEPAVDLAAASIPSAPPLPLSLPAPEQAPGEVSALHEVPRPDAWISPHELAEISERRSTLIQSLIIVAIFAAIGGLLAAAITSW
jgi:hypothetical protein